MVKESCSDLFCLFTRVWRVISSLTLCKCIVSWSVGCIVLRLILRSVFLFSLAAAPAANSDSSIADWGVRGLITTPLPSGPTETKTTEPCSKRSVEVERG